MSDKKWIDRGKDAPPSLISPRTLELVQAQADEFRKRAEAAEAEVADRKAFAAGLEKACEELRIALDSWRKRAERAEIGNASRDQAIANLKATHEAQIRGLNAVIEHLRDGGEDDD